MLPIDSSSGSPVPLAEGAELLVALIKELLHREFRKLSKLAEHGILQGGGRRHVIVMGSPHGFWNNTIDQAELQ